MPRFQLNDEVYVPTTKLPLPAVPPYALCKVTVQAVQRRRITVSHPRLPNPIAIDPSLAHKNPGVAITRIGDYDSEAGLLDPLAKAILHFLRLLFEEDTLRLQEIRTIRELIEVSAANAGLYSHHIVIAHGNGKGLRFGRSKWVPAERIGKIFEKADPAPKHFVALCCKSGLKAFASAFSLNSDFRASLTVTFA